MKDQEFYDNRQEIAEPSIRPVYLMPDTVLKCLVNKYLHLLHYKECLQMVTWGEVSSTINFCLYRLNRTPPNNAKPYPVPRVLKSKPRELIQPLIHIDMIEQITIQKWHLQPSFWRIPTVYYVFWLNFAVFNRYMQRSFYYVGRILEILLNLVSSKCIATFDTNIGYHVRCLDTPSFGYTAFYLPFRTFNTSDSDGNFYGT